MLKMRISTNTYTLAGFGEKMFFEKGDKKVQKHLEHMLPRNGLRIAVYHLV